MATFDELAARGDAGLVWLLDVCTAGDDFATVQYRWATHAGVIGGEFYEARLPPNGIGNVMRGFGQDHLPASASISLIVDNTDFSVDWLCSPVSVQSSVFKARFRLSVGLTDDTLANTYQATVVTKQLGVFICLENPKRNAASVLLTLADDSIGKLADLLVAPSLANWYDDAGTTASNAVFFGQNPILDHDWSTPFPLSFGPGPHSAKVLNLSYETPLATQFNAGTPFPNDRNVLYSIPVCATRDTVTVTANDAVALDAIFKLKVDERPELGGTRVTIPKTFTEANGTVVQIWEAYKTPTITVNGYNWKILHLVFNAFAYFRWWRASPNMIPPPSGLTGYHAHGIPVRQGGAGQTHVGLYFQSIPAQYAADLMGAFEEFQVYGGPASGITGKANINAMGNPVDVLEDFVTHYSALGASAVDTTRFARARLASRVRVKGQIAPARALVQGGDAQLSADNRGPYGVGLLRKSIADLAASSDLDVFMTMAGQVAVVVQGADFETASTTYPIIAEERMSEQADGTPTGNERWAAYNRVYLLTRQGEQVGPYDNAEAITEWGRILSRVLPSKWWWDVFTAQTLAFHNRTDPAFPWTSRNLEARARPIFKFTTDLGALVHELGDYFTASWTRGGNNTIYDAVLWRLESVLIGGDGKVQCAAVWMADLQDTSERAYILDNEALVERVAATFGRTCTVTDASATAVFASGDLVADGVAVGDILRLRDASEAATTFYRNRDVAIVGVAATQLTLDGDLDFGTAGAHVVVEWSIVRGFTTYPNVGDAPASYPSGSEMYGKISDAAGKFSDETLANQLKEG